jgi:hypothetical protein
MAKFTLDMLRQKKEENKNKKISVDLRNYNMILYGMPDAGKTTLASALFEGQHILLACEYGSSASLCSNDVPVASYKDLLEVTKVLATKEAYEEFGGVCIIDTLTRLGEIITSHILNKYNKDFMADVKSFNGAYALIDKLYNELFAPMKQIGWSFVYICHSDEEELTDENGNSYIRYDLQTNKRLAKIVSKECQLAWFISKKGTKDGQKRTLVTNESMWNFGKNKVSIAEDLPLFIELKDNERDSAKVIKDAFVKACEGYGKDRVTKEVGKSSVEAFSDKVRDIEEIKAEMIQYGGMLSGLGLREAAIECMNRALGTDYNGEQRTIDMATQENAEALEIGISQMKALYEKYSE